MIRLTLRDGVLKLNTLRCCYVLNCGNCHCWLMIVCQLIHKTVSINGQCRLVAVNGRTCHTHRHFPLTEVVINMSLLTKTLLQRLCCWPITVGNGVKTHSLDQNFNHRRTETRTVVPNSCTLSLNDKSFLNFVMVTTVFYNRTDMNYSRKKILTLWITISTFSSIESMLSLL